MPNVLTKLAPKVTIIELIPNKFKNKDYSNARHISGLTHEMLMSFEIRGMIEEQICRNPHYTTSSADTNELIAESFGKPLTDCLDLTGATDMMFKTNNQLYAKTINCWTVAGFMLDDHLDQIGAHDRHIISEWQKKYLLGKSDGTTGFDKMLVKAIKMTKDMLTADQYVRHVVYCVTWIGTYLTVNQTKYYETKVMTYEEYWYNRERDIGMVTFNIFTERCCNLDVLTHDLLDDPLWQAFNITNAKHAVLVNEIYSVKSEVLKDEGKYSYLYLLMAHQGWDCQQAIDQMVAEVHYQWYACINYGSQLVEYGIPELTEYVHQVMYVLKGNIYWSAICPRMKNVVYRMSTLPLACDPCFC